MHKGPADGAGGRIGQVVDDDTGASQAVGDRWLAAARSLALRVPSIHSASDANLLINPLHRAAGRLVVAGSRPYAFDPRLFAV